MYTQIYQLSQGARMRAAASQVFLFVSRGGLPTMAKVMPFELPRAASLHVSAPLHHATSSKGDGDDACKDNQPLTKKLVQKDLPPQFVKFIESGFLQAMRELRDSLLEEEWESHGKRAAQQAAVAGFEAALAAEGLIRSSGGSSQPPDKPKTPQISYDTLTQLYQDPDNLEVIEDDVLRARLRSMMQQSLDERMREAFRDATSRAEDMARLLKEGPGSIVEIIQRLLPIPKFLKGK